MKNGPYILSVAPEEYPGKKYRERYIYEHHLVWWKNTGQVISPGFVVHHRNHIKTDNRFENLELMELSEHMRGHAKKPEIFILKCTWCTKDFNTSARNHRVKIRKGQRNFYCCRSHQVTHQHRIIRENGSRKVI